MADNKAAIQNIKNEIQRIKSYMDSKKKSVQSLKSDKSRVADRYKDQIKRADKAGKERLRDRKKKEIDGFQRQTDSLKKTIEDYKRQISRLREQISKLKK